MCSPKRAKPGAYLVPLSFPHFWQNGKLLTQESQSHVQERTAHLITFFSLTHTLLLLLKTTASIAWIPSKTQMAITLVLVWQKIHFFPPTTLSLNYHSNLTPNTLYKLLKLSFHGGTQCIGRSSSEFSHFSCSATWIEQLNSLDPVLISLLKHLHWSTRKLFRRVSCYILEAPSEFIFHFCRYAHWIWTLIWAWIEVFCGVHCVYSWPIIRIDVYLSSDSSRFGEIVFLVLMFAVCFSSFWDLISWSMLDLWVWFELHDVVWYINFNLSLISWILVKNHVCLMDLK